MHFFRYSWQVMTLLMNIEIQAFRKGNCGFIGYFKPIKISIAKVFCMDFIKMVRWLLLLKAVR